MECRFKPERLEHLAKLESTHFWFAGRRAFLNRLLGRHLRAGAGLVLDVGCGTASSLDLLGRHGKRAIGLDRLLEGLASSRQAGSSKRLVRAEATTLPFTTSSLDAVTLLDVAEHVQDEALLREVARVLRPGGLVVVSVPAFSALWSHRDEAAGHLRRYSRPSLLGLLESASLVVRETRYFQCLLLPLVFVTRRLGREGPAMRDLEERPGPLLNRLFLGLTLLEVRLGEFVSWPAGSSLFAVAEKPHP